jgi:hypothetical protein
LALSSQFFKLTRHHHPFREWPRLPLQASHLSDSMATFEGRPLLPHLRPIQGTCKVRAMKAPQCSPISTESDLDSVILIFGWMGAELSHLHKYTATYSVLYPTTTIILVRSPLSSFWSSSSGLASSFRLFSTQRRSFVFRR